MNPDLLRVRTNQWLFALGRLRPGVTREGAQSALVTLQLGLDPPDRPRPRNPAERITLAPVSAGPPEAREPLLSVATLLAIVVGTVLLIACANVSNLLLLRAATRGREIGIRLAVGAGRDQIVRQMLTESVLLALLGGLLGTLLAYGLMQLFLAWPPPAGALPLVVEPSLGGRVLLFALLLSLGTGVIFGLLPALHTARTTLVPLLTDDAVLPVSRSRRLTVRNALMVAQVTLSLALLVVADLFFRSLQEARHIDPGYAVDRLLRLDLPLNLLRYTRAQGSDFYRRGIERVEAIPGVQSVAVARVPVLTGTARSSSLHIEGRAGANTAFTSEGTGAIGPADETLANVVSPKYFDTMGLRLTAGRDFGPEDAEGATATLIVNEAFVQRHLAGSKAICTRVSVNGPEGPWRVIVGIASDGKYRSLSEPRSPIVFLPLSQIMKQA